MSMLYLEMSNETRNMKHVYAVPGNVQRKVFWHNQNCPEK